jgi:asparagine synthase (glutamine-hydrolysing)
MGDGWLVFPDHPAAATVVGGLAPRLRPLLSHPSGRPFLVGDVGELDAGGLTCCEVGSVRVAVIGSCPVTATRLSELAAGVESLGALDALVTSLSGCFHTLASVDGLVRVQGSVSGLRRVFHTRVDGLTVAGDRADRLARLTGAGVDAEALAVRVACGWVVSPPVGDRSLWRGVHYVPGDHYLRIDTDATPTQVAWWSPPPPQLTLAQGANQLRETLTLATRARRDAAARPGSPGLGADLSGGMDSTSLCFLLEQARPTEGLVTMRWAEAGAGHDDTRYAALAAEALPEAQHVVLSQAELPSVFHDPGAVGDTEAPFGLSRTLARIRYTATRLAELGVGMQVVGHGGDELFHGALGYLPALLRRNPRLAIGQLRGFRALHRWSWPDTVAAIRQASDLPTWWQHQARDLSQDDPLGRAPSLGWGEPVRAAGWVTPDALAATRAALTAASHTAQPLAPYRGQHTILAAVRTMGSLYRQMVGVYAASGVHLELPYFDDRVLEASLAVRDEQRRTPWRYKPLLSQAMQGIVPSEILARVTKGESSADVRAGLRRNRAAVLDILSESALAAAGLIDPTVLRRELLRPQPDHAVMFALEDLLGCEAWLRAAQQPATGSRRNDAPSTAH